MSGPLSAVVAGHLCLDVLPDFEHLTQQNMESLFKPGRLVNIGPAKFSSGGAVSNTGLALAYLGIPTHLIAKVGEDPFGSILKGIISKKGPELVNGFLTDSKEITSYSLIISNQVTDRLFLHCTGANDTFTAEDIDFELVKQAALFHFGYPSLLGMMYQDDGNYLLDVMRRAKATLVTTSLDMTLPDPASASGQVNWRKIYEKVLPFVDIFLPSIEEIIFTLRHELFLQMAARGDIISQVTPQLLESISQELLDMGVKMVVLKMGSCGIYLRTAPEQMLKSIGRAKPFNEKNWANCERWIPCFKVKVVGTTGSGDSAIAGFLSALLRSCTIDEALAIAVAVGACNVEALDSLSGLRTWDATRERVKKGWEQLPLDPGTPGWNWDENKKMWIGPLEGKHQ